MRLLNVKRPRERNFVATGAFDHHLGFLEFALVLALGRDVGGGLLASTFVRHFRKRMGRKVRVSMLSEISGYYDGIRERVGVRRRRFEVGIKVKVRRRRVE